MSGISEARISNKEKEMNSEVMGQKVINWLHETDSSNPLADLSRDDLIEIVKHQTSLIATDGLQPGCVIVVPKSYTRLPYRTGIKVQGPVLLRAVWIDKGKTFASCVDIRGYNVPGQLEINLAEFTPATEKDIVEIIERCFGAKWSFM